MMYSAEGLKTPDAKVSVAEQCNSGSIEVGYGFGQQDKIISCSMPLAERHWLHDAKSRLQYAHGSRANTSDACVVEASSQWMRESRPNHDC